MSEVDQQRQIADLRMLLDISRQLGAVTELLPLLKQIEQAALTVLDCERVTVFLYDPKRDELYSKVATGAADIRIAAKAGIAGEAAQSMSLVKVSDAYSDPRFNPEVDRQTGFVTRSLLSVPMSGHDGRLVGVLQVLNKRRGPFTAVDDDLALTLASLAGVAVHRQMLIEEYTEKQRLERELAIAREIQQALLPRSNPVLTGYDVAGWNCPADETGGDCFDFIPVAEDKLAMMVADATGHGIGPALIVSECRALLRAMTSVSHDLGRIMSRVNRLIGDDLPGGRFVTTFFGMLDSAQHRIEYVSAGHGPMLLVCGATGESWEFHANMVPLGVLDHVDARPASPVALSPGDVFIIMTDGFFEWYNPDGEQFGTHRVVEVIRQNMHDPMSDLIAALRDAVLTFAAGVPQADDLTIIALKRLA